MASLRVVYVPLSERNAIPRLWTDDTLYINCYDSIKNLCNGVCIYDLLDDSEKKLCPLKENIAQPDFDNPKCLCE